MRWSRLHLVAIELGFEVEPPVEPLERATRMELDPDDRRFTLDHVERASGNDRGPAAARRRDQDARVVQQDQLLVDFDS